METTIIDREQRITKLQDQIIELQKNMMMNQKSASSSSPPPPPRADEASTTSRLGSLFLANPDAAPSSVTLPSIFPEAPNSATSACSCSSSSSAAGVRKPSRIPSANRRRSGESRSRCKSRVDRPLSSNAAQEKTVEEMKVEIQVGRTKSWRGINDDGINGDEINDLCEKRGINAGV